MDRDLRVLIVEHIPEDVELMKRELGKGDMAFDSRIVEDEAGLRRELEDFRPDIVLSDYYIPGFDVKEVIRLTRENRPRTPVLVISGWIAEDKVLECMESGAADFVSKAHMGRLVSSVKSALAI